MFLSLLRPFRNILVILFFGVVACVTVNVNFPESTVQQATDDYVEELYKARQQIGNSSGEVQIPAPQKKDAKKKDSTSFINWIPEAHADINLEFRVKTPKSDAILQREAGRLGQLAEFMGKPLAAIGEGSDGYVVYKGDDKSLKAGQVIMVKKLITDENEDRKELYAEILSANQFSRDKLPQIQKSFARSFQKKAPGGTWIQGDDGKWSQK